MTQPLYLKAYGKVNLGLDVIRRREDGYHEVRMIMQTVKLYDRIILERNHSGRITLRTNLPYLPVNEKNLVYRAIDIIRREYAIADGVEFLYGARPVEITDDGVRYQMASFDGDGNVTGLSEPKLFPCSSVIVAVSQGALNRIVSTTKGLQTDPRGLLTTDAEGQTTRPGVFAGGDVVSGARTVVEAVKYSKEVARAMDEYLQTVD